MACVMERYLKYGASQYSHPCHGNFVMRISPSSFPGTDEIDSTRTSSKQSYDELQLILQVNLSKESA